MYRRFVLKLLCRLLIACLAALQGSMVCAQDITSNLVGHWKFDENTGSSAADSSGNNNTGTINGASWSSGGKDGSCLDFDGSFDYVSIANSASLQISGDITISAWVKADTISAQHCIVGHGTTTSSVQNTYLYIWYSAWLGGSHQSGNDEYASSSVSSGDIGSWVHIAIVYDDEDWFLYRNGSLIDSHETEQGAVNVSSSRWAIGAPSTLTSRFFDGLIDEVRIYGRALSGADITEIYNTENTSSSSSSSSSLYLSTDSGATLGGLTFEDEDIINYDADADTSTRTFEGDAVYSFDEETNGIHVQSNGKILLTTESSAIIGTLFFNDEDIVEYDPTTGIATMIFDGSAVNSSIGEINALSLLDNGNIVISTTSSATIGSLSFNDDDLVEYNPTSGTATMLLDGSTVITSVDSETDRDINGVHVFSNGQMLLSLANDSNINGLQFGDDDVVLYDPGSGTATLYFDGGALFSSSSEDVDGISLIGSAGLIAHWKLDEGSGTTLADDSGNGNSASFGNGTPTWTTGVRSGALQFNGSNDVSTDANIDPPEVGSIAFWFRSNASPTSTERILGVSDTWEIHLDSSGSLHCDLSGPGSSGTFGTSNSVAEAGRWRHVVVIYNTTDDTYKLYVDGVLDSSGAYTCADEDPGILTLGSRTGSVERFNGALDDVRIYSYELSEPEIAVIYGLVGHWKLDEASGTTATDSSLNANDGTHNSGVTVGQTGPYSGILAVDYDGSNNFTDVAYGGNWNPVENEFSLATWVRIDAGGDTHGMVVWGSNSTPYALLTNSSNQVELRTNWGTVSGESGEFTHNSTGTLTVGQWHHVAVTYDGSTTRFYIDGTEDSTSSATVTIGTTTDKLQLGGDDGSVYDLTGAMYDARVYNRVISADEVNDLAGVPVATGLVGHWKMDETSGTLAADSSGNGFDGTYENGVSVGQTGVRSYGSGFDGVDDGVRISHHSGFDITDAITVASWVKFNNLSGWQRIISKSTSHAFQFRLKGDTGTIGLELEGLTGTNDIELTHEIPLDEWIHVVGVYDGTSIKIYYNGQLDNQASASGSISTDASSDVMLGNRGTGGSPLNGYMDDARIYNIALNDQAIAELYGLVGHWKLDETSGTVAVDSSGVGNNGTYQSGFTLATEEVYPGRSAAEFDGTTGIVRIPHHGVYDITEAITLAAWIRADSLNTSNTIVAKGDTAWRLHQNNSNERFAGHFNLSGGGWTTGAESLTYPGHGRWLHVVSTYDGSDLKVYINGQLEESASVPGTMVTNAVDVTIGENLEYPGRFWHGGISDVRVYNRALNLWEINKIYGRLGYWKLDETTGSLAIDSAGRDNDATLTGSPTLGVNGSFVAKTGTAIELDGSAEYIATDKSLLNNLPGFGMAGWVRTDSLQHDQSFFGQNDLVEFGIKDGNGQLLLWTAYGGYIYSSNQMPLGKWTHVAATGDGTNINMYVNGQQVATGGSSTASYGSSSSFFKLGEGVWNSSGDYLDGRLDEVQVFDRPLSAEEVRVIYRGGRPDGIRIIRWLETR